MLVFEGPRFVVAAEPSGRVAKPADTVCMFRFQPPLIPHSWGNRIMETEGHLQTPGRRHPALLLPCAMSHLL